MKRVRTLLNSYFIFFTICVIVKFYILRYMLFNDTNVFHTIWYEISIVLPLFLILELIFKRIKLLLYILLDLILSIMFFGLVVYEKYFGTIPTYHDLAQLNQLGSVRDSVGLLIAPSDFIFFADFIILSLLLAIRKYTQFPRDTTFQKKITVLVMVLAIAIATANFELKQNERILDQALFSENYGVLNGQLIKGYKEQVVYSYSNTDISTISVDDIIQIKGNEPVPFTQHNYYGMARKRNLIVIQIESLQDFVLNRQVNGQEITPNINEWLKDSFYFSKVFQQIGAGNTSDAEFIMNTSIYPKGETPTSKDVTGKKFTSLPMALDQQGYTTATFHADDVEYWDRNLLYPALGFDEYYDIEFYENKDVIGIGPSDEVFYKKTMEKLMEYQQKEKPFYAHVLSLTSHTPFEMPADKERLDLPAKYKDTLIGNYLQSVRYADHALGKFFDDMKENGLWDDSIIALYGDHSGVHGQLLKDKDVKLLHDLLGKPYSLVDRFNIPFIVGVPGETDKRSKRIDTIGGQMDMMPTIMNLMGVKPLGLYFGQDLLQYEHNLLGMRYYLPTGSFFNDEVLYVPKTSKHDIRIYNLNDSDKASNEKKQQYQKDFENMLQIYDWSDAYFKSFENRAL